MNEVPRVGVRSKWCTWSNTVFVLHAKGSLMKSKSLYESIRFYISMEEQRTVEGRTKAISFLLHGLGGGVLQKVTVELCGID